MQMTRYNQSDFDIKCCSFDEDIMLWISTEKIVKNKDDYIFVIDNSHNMFDNIYEECVVPQSPKNININDLHSLIASPSPTSQYRVISPSMSYRAPLLNSSLSPPDSPKKTSSNKIDILKNSLISALVYLSEHNNNTTILVCSSSVKVICNKLKLTTNNIESVIQTIRELVPHGSLQWSSVFDYINSLSPKKLQSIDESTTQTYDNYPHIVICTTDESINLFRSVYSFKPIVMSCVKVLNIGYMTNTNIDFFQNKSDCYIGLSESDVANKLLNIMYSMVNAKTTNLKITLVDSVDDSVEEKGETYHVAVDDRVVNMKPHRLLPKLSKSEKKLEVNTHLNIKSNVIQLDSVVIGNPIIMLLNKHTCFFLEYDDKKFTLFTEILLQYDYQLTKTHINMYKCFTNTLRMFEQSFDNSFHKKMHKIISLFDKQQYLKKDTVNTHILQLYTFLENRVQLYYNLSKKRDITKIVIADYNLLRSLKLFEIVCKREYSVSDEKIPIVIERSTCKICKSRCMNMIVYPCKHSNICDQCMHKSNICPVCKTEITYFKRISVCNLDMKCLECKTKTVTSCLVCKDKHAFTYYCIACSNKKLKKHKCEYQITNDKQCKKKMVGILDFYLAG